MESPQDQSPLFSELVADLLNGVRDGIEAAQLYQEERYDEVASAIDLPALEFIRRYVSDDDLEEKEQEIIGRRLQEGLGKRDLLNLEELIGKLNLEWFREGRLSSQGVKDIRAIIREMAAAERKGQFRRTISDHCPTRVLVESGEIRAKVEIKGRWSKRGDDALAHSQEAEKDDKCQVNTEVSTPLHLPLSGERKLIGRYASLSSNEASVSELRITFRVV